jgi:predicted lipoprotein with Yx(FWY)xxD motif
MRTTARAPVLLALGTLVLAGCGGDGGDTGSSDSRDSPAAADATLRTADSDLGDIVVDADERTVYVFDQDEPGSGESACADDCLEQWPPVVAEDEEPTADGVDGELGTIERDDGTLQVTLGGSPLYLFAGDGGPGDVTGQAVGDVWWVVGADGKKITEAPDTGSDFSY